VTGAGSNGGPHVRIFSSQGKLKGQFMAYENNFRGGVQVAVGNIDYGAKANQAEIIVTPGAGRSPEVRIFRSNGRRVNAFQAFNNNFQLGVSVSMSDLNNDGLPEIIAAAGTGGAPQVRAFNALGELRESWYVYDQSFLGGIKASPLNLSKQYFN
jgi:hypothetical protein